MKMAVQISRFNIRYKCRGKIVRSDIFRGLPLVFFPPIKLYLMRLKVNPIPEIQRIHKVGHAHEVNG